MAWIPIGAWIAAAVITVLVLGYFAVDFTGKIKRLQRDVRSLDTVAGQLQQVQRELGVAAARARQSLAAKAD